MEDTLVCNPRDQAGFLSLLTASWINDVLKLGSKQPLEEKHLLAVGASYQAERLVADLEREWLAEERTSEQNRTKPRLWRAMMKVIPCRDYVIVAFLRLFYFIGFNLFPLIVWFFLKSISTSREISYKTTLPIIIGIALVTFMRTVSSNYATFKMDILATKLKVAMTGLVYKKASNFHQKSGSIKRGITGKMTENRSQDEILRKRIIFQSPQWESNPWPSRILVERWHSNHWATGDFCWVKSILGS